MKIINFQAESRIYCENLGQVRGPYNKIRRAQIGRMQLFYSRLLSFDMHLYTLNRTMNVRGKCMSTIQTTCKTDFKLLDGTKFALCSISKITKWHSKARF